MWGNESTVGRTSQRATRHPPPARPGGAARPLSLAVGLALAAWGAPASAACRIVSTTPMTFTNFSPLGAEVAATATLAYVCVGRTTSATLSISTPRAMTSGGSTLPFELHVDGGRTTVFPGSPALDLAIAPFGVVTVYGQLPPRDVAPGTYTARLTVTLTSNGTQVRTSPLDVSTTFLGSCEIQPGTLAFGAYDPLSATPRDATATIAISCTRATPYAVALGAGNHAAGAARQMSGPGGGLLRYELYADPARAIVWNATSTVTGTTPSTAPIPLVVFGRVPAGQLVQAGAYSDVVQSTINF